MRIQEELLVGGLGQLDSEQDITQSLNFFQVVCLVHRPVQVDPIDCHLDQVLIFESDPSCVQVDFEQLADAGFVFWLAHVPFQLIEVSLVKVLVEYEDPFCITEVPSDSISFFEQDRNSLLPSIWNASRLKTGILQKSPLRSF